MDQSTQRYQSLLGKALVEISKSSLGENATLSQMAHFASSKMNISAEEAKALIVKSC